MLERSPADLAILVGSPPNFGTGAGIFVPFGGGEHDWAALELAGWLASATDVSPPARRDESGSRARPP